MTSEEYADEVSAAVEAVRGRILGVGAEQYDDGTGVQRFEGRSLGDVVQDALEEVEDLVAYAVQMRIKLKKLKDTIEI